MGYNPTAIPTVAVASKFPALEARLKELKEIRKEALAAHEMARVTMAERITRSFIPFKVGDKVLLDIKNLRSAGGMFRKFRQLRSGPFTVEEVLGPVTFKIRLPRAWKNIHPVFHASVLKAFRETEVHGPAFPEPPPKTIEGEEEWEVDSIMRHWRYRGGHIKYFTSWVGYGPEHHSWESEDAFEHAPDVLKAYKRLHDLDTEVATDSADIVPECSPSSLPSGSSLLQLLCKQLLSLLTTHGNGTTILDQTKALASIAGG